MRSVSSICPRLVFVVCLTVISLSRTFPEIRALTTSLKNANPLTSSEIDTYQDVSKVIELIYLSRSPRMVLPRLCVHWSILVVSGLSNLNCFTLAIMDAASTIYRQVDNVIFSLLICALHIAISFLFLIIFDFSPLVSFSLSLNNYLHLSIGVSSISNNLSATPYNPSYTSYLQTVCWSESQFVLIYYLQHALLSRFFRWSGYVS